MITRPEELMDYVFTLLDTKKAELGLNYITFGDGKLRPFYPAASIVYDAIHREDHTTHYFKTEIAVDIFLMHAKMSIDRMQRTREDLELASQVTAFLHADRTLGGQVVSSIVTSEAPGQIETDNALIIGTQLHFVATQRESFR